MGVLKGASKLNVLLLLLLLFADVIRIAADLAIGHHRGPLSGRCKQGIKTVSSETG